MSFKTFLEAKLGDCYQQAYKYFNDNTHKDKNLRLVHGLVTGQGSLDGVVYNHAWCESGNTVIDNTMPNPKMPKSLYYKIGKIKTTYHYTFEEMLEKIMKYQTYGPWETKLLRNKF